MGTAWKATIDQGPQGCGPHSLMRTAQGDQSIAAVGTAVATTAEAFTAQIRTQHHTTGAVTDQRHPGAGRTALKLTHSRINPIQQTSPTEAPAGGQPVETGNRHNLHRCTGACRNPFGERGVRLDGDQEAPENDNGLIKGNT